MRNVVVLFGKISSGKSTCALYVQKKYYYTVFEIGDNVRDSYRGDQNYTGTLADYANLHYSQGRLTYFVSNVISQSRNYQGNLLFSGVRTVEELSRLKDEFPNLILIRIECTTDNRSQRYYKEKSDNISFEKRDKVEDNWMKNEWDSIQFDYTIPNNDSLDDFYKRIDSVFSEIAKGDLI